MVATACSASNEVETHRSAPTFSEGIVMSDSREGLETNPMGRFNFGYLRSLWVRVTIKTDMPGDPATVRLNLYTPKYDNYYEETLRFSLDPQMQQVPVPGMPYPSPVQRARKVPGGIAFDYPIAVEGRDIFQKRLIPQGMWNLQAQVTGVPGTFSVPVEITRSR
jgi:hypothetical protein